MEWRKSSYSSRDVNESCVEVAPLGSAVGVRDSKASDGRSLTLAPTAWRTFTATTRHGGGPSRERGR